MQGHRICLGRRSSTRRPASELEVLEYVRDAVALAAQALPVESVWRRAFLDVKTTLTAQIREQSPGRGRIT